jgi:hypothetical protein
MNKKTRANSTGPESFSGILAHLYSGAIDLNSRLSDALWHGVSKVKQIFSGRHQLAKS